MPAKQRNRHSHINAQSSQFGLCVVDCPGLSSTMSKLLTGELSSRVYILEKSSNHRIVVLCDGNTALCPTTAARAKSFLMANAETIMRVKKVLHTNIFNNIYIKQSHVSYRRS